MHLGLTAVPMDTSTTACTHMHTHSFCVDETAHLRQFILQKLRQLLSDSVLHADK